MEVGLWLQQVLARYGDPNVRCCPDVMVNAKGEVNHLPDLRSEPVLA